MPDDHSPEPPQGTPKDLRSPRYHPPKQKYPKNESNFTFNKKSMIRIYIIYINLIYLKEYLFMKFVPDSSFRGVV